MTALTGLTIYLVLLCGIPSNMTISALGSVGRPAVLWGLILALWWVIHRLHAPRLASSSPSQPVRVAYAAIVVVVLVGFAAALLRGQPADQVTSATGAVLRLASWGGVLLVAMDGITTMRDLRRLIDRIVLLATIVAILGLVQTFSGQTLVDQLAIPGFELTEEGGVQSRGAFVRATGTATHPLEFAMLLTCALPLALTSATARSGDVSRRAWPTWSAVVILGVTLLVSASRSAILGFALVLLATLPALHGRLRGMLIAGSAVAVAVIAVVRPGMLGTMLSAFTGVDSDSSAQSRSDALERAPEFLSVSPWYGSGFGTFLSRYYIFDNQWVLTTVELGVLGLLAFAGLICAAMWSAWHARRLSAMNDVRVLGQGLLAACLGGAVALIGFDGLSFPISAGVLFLVMGTTASLRAIAHGDRWMADVRRAGVDDVVDGHDRPVAAG